MKAMWYVWCLLILFQTASCKKEAGNEVTTNVNVNTSGIFKPIEIRHKNEFITDLIDFGEYEIGTGDTTKIFTIKNNSSFPMTDINVVFPTEERFRAYHYAIDQTTGDRIFPGAGGTCARTLGSGQQCTIVLAINVDPELGTNIYTQPVTFSYNNLVQNETKTLDFKVFAGYAASLIFQDDETQFSFGNLVRSDYLVERTEVKSWHQELIVTNAGDLTARDVAVSFSTLSCNSESANGGDGANCTTLSSDFRKKNLTDAWQIIHNCPTTLKKNETCKVNVYFHVPNQDPATGPVPEEILSIKYNITANLAFKKNPANALGALNGYFNNIISTKIQAKFEPNQPETNFENDVIAGRRESVTFLLKNTGYQAGILHQVYIHNRSDNAILGACIDTGLADNFLECFETTTEDGEGLNTPTKLKNLPFFVKDRSNCLVADGENPVLVGIDEICVMDVFFQPSVQFTTERDLQIDLALRYDTRWQGQVSMTKHRVHQIEASSTTAARVVIESINYNAKACNATSTSCKTLDLTTRHRQYEPKLVAGVYVGCEDRVNKLTISASTVSQEDCQDKYAFNFYQTMDVGRIALVNQAFAAGQEIDVSITLKNIGKQPATNTRFYVDYLDTDGDLVRAGQVTIGSELNPISLGTNASYPYFKELKYNQADCNTIIENGTCTISFKLHPISLANNCQNVSSMFSNEDSGAASAQAGIDCDVVSNVANQLQFSPYRIFSVEYDDASYYYDDNLFSSTANVGKRITDVKMYGILVTKGALSTLANKGFTVEDHIERRQIRTIIMQNVGTGKIGYMGWTGYRSQQGTNTKIIGDSFDEKQNYNILPVDDPSLYQADYDCAKIIDFAYVPGVTNMTTILARKDASIKTMTGSLTREQVNHIKNSWSGDQLDVGEKCVLRFDIAAERKGVFATKDQYLNQNSFTATSEKAYEAFMATLSLKEFGSASAEDYSGFLMNNLNFDFKVALEYYDGDNEPSSNPNIQTLINNGETTNTHTTVAFGGLITKENSSLGEANISLKFKKVGYPAIDTPKPLMSAFIVKKPLISDVTNIFSSAPTQAQLTYEDLWYWYTTTLVETSMNSTVNVADFFQGGLAASNTTLYNEASNYFVNPTNADFVVHFGTFSLSEVTQLSFDIMASSFGSTIKIIDEDINILTSDPNAFVFTSTDLADENISSSAYELASSTSKTRKIDFNTSIPGNHALLFTLKYTDDRNVDPLCASSCAKKVHQVKYVLFAKTIDNAPKLTLETQECLDPNLDDGDFSCNWQAGRTTVNMLYNNQGADTKETILFEQIVQENPTLTTHAYKRRRIHIKNKTNTAINNFRLIYKNELTDTVLTNMTTDVDSEAITIMRSNGVNNDGCQDEIDARYFPANHSCYIEIVYQPIVETSFETEFYFNFMYELASAQYVHQAINLKFKPESPAKLAPDTTLSSLSVAFAPKYDDPATTTTSLVQFGPANRTYEYNHTTILTLDSTNASRIYSASIPILNNSETKASFLRAFQQKEGLAEDALVEPSDYETVDGFVGVNIYERTTSIGIISIYANEDCLVGDDSETNPALKGFDKDDSCQLKIKYDLNVNASGINILSSNVTDSYFILPYWNYKRASSDQLYMYLRFRVMPNKSNAVAYGGVDFYTDVQAIHAGTKSQVSFSWNDMTPTDYNMGDITGYRVYYAESASDMVDLLNINGVWGALQNKFLGYQDTTPNNRTVTIGNLTKGKKYYFKVLPIRAHASYDRNQFVGLQGEYLGESNIPWLYVVTPPNNYHYDHNSFRLYHTILSSFEANPSTFSYNNAINYCHNRRQNILSGSTNINTRHKLIDPTARDFLINNPSLSNYTFGSEMHWINRSLQTVEQAKFSNLPGYSESDTSQTLFASGNSYYYVRDINNPSAPLAHFYGRFGSVPEGTYGLAINDLVFDIGYARCYINLSDW